MKFLDSILADEEDTVETKKARSKETKEASTEPLQKHDVLWRLAPFVVLLLALSARLAYIFVFSDPNFPGWYTDVFHHWQIAYLSKEVGFSHGFLRLWDFKGMEFFWGLLHPLVLTVIFTVTGSISIVTTRLLSAFGGALSIAFMFMLLRRYFNSHVAWATGIFATLFPLTLFSNSAGMQEELAMPLVLGALLIWNGAPLLAGILLALASMVRAEYWLFSFGLVAASFLLRKNLDKAAVVFMGYIVVIVIYMKYLASYTNNYIYPIYYNFLASVKGDWFVDLPIVGAKLVAKRISQGIFTFGVIGALVTLWKRPKYALFFLFGFGNIIFIGFMVGFGAYVKGYIDRFWVDRLYNWPYLFSTILVIIFLLHTLPKFAGNKRMLAIVGGWMVVFSMLTVSQLVWRPIGYFMQPVEEIYLSEQQQAAEIGAAYEEGSVLVPEDRPYITYFLAHDWGVEGKHMVGQMFDPFFYFEDRNNLFGNWGEDRETVLNWLKDENIKLIALTGDKASYLGLIEREPGYFVQVPSETVKLYRVNIAD